MNEDDFLYDGRDLEALANMVRYQGWIVDHFRPYLRGKIIEYGAGAGNISALLASQVEQLCLVEPSLNLVAKLKSRFSGISRISIHPDTLEQHLQDQPSASTDGIILVNVLEHLEDDVAALAQMARVLKPGGHLMLFVPALQFLMSPLDLHYGHKRRYHRSGLMRLVHDSGLEIARVKYMDVVGIAAWFVVHKLGRRTQFNNGMSNIYDRVFVPLTRRLESMVSPRIGKSLVLVARKPVRQGN